MCLARCICRIMSNETPSALEPPDSAAVFACALSLWRASQAWAVQRKLSLSECYKGMDQFMREVMHIANQFEAWACLHINFNELEDVWPYLLEDKFGEACLVELVPNTLAQFDDTVCLRLALRLRLPVIFMTRCQSQLT